MPPIAQAQGSRTGIITALVCSIILAVTMTVVAIYGYQKWGESEHDLQNLREVHRPFLADNDSADARVTALRDLAAAPGGPYTGMSALQVSIAQTEQLEKLIGGNTADSAIAAGRNALKDAAAHVQDLNNKKLVSFTLPTDGTLVSALSATTDQLGQVATGQADLRSQLTASEQSKQQLIAAQKAQLDEKDKLIQDANAKAEASATEAKQAQQQAADAQAALQASANSSLKQLQDVNAALTTQLQAKDKQILADTKTIAGFRSKLRTARVNPTEPIIQHADGNIIRVTENHTCFINLGSREHVTKGLTFEVYDKARGIPPLGDGLSDNGLPIGKASIEVFSVGPDTSECRIVKTEPGQQIVIGDLITNLIYDPSIAYNFVVYGDFDLSGSGIASPTDAEVIKRLITQWGGKVQDRVDVNTDFVIMGAEPVVPAITDANDANIVMRHNTQLAKQQQFQAVITAANQLSIPVMNQNRFLYFIGYFDQAGR